MSDMDTDDWEKGSEYLLWVGSGPTRAQVEAVLDPHFHPDGDSFASAQWDVDETDPDEVALGYPWIVSVDGWPGPRSTRHVLTQALGVPVEDEYTLADVETRTRALTATA